MTRAEIDRQIRALDEGRAHLDLDGWALTEVGGPDAPTWLNDLVTAAVGGLEPGRSVRSLLLSPTGRIRADLHVLRAARRGPYLLLQSPGQPEHAADLLEPYVLSSEVTVARAEPDGLAVVPSVDGEWSLAEERSSGTRSTAGPEAFEAWRIRHKIARFPLDLDTDSLPAEAGLDAAPVIDRDKGCYLGQESVARVRNLGHPARVVVAVRAREPLRPGVVVLAEGSPAGSVTSVEPGPPEVAAMARVRWDARDAEFETEGGIALDRR